MLSISCHGRFTTSGTVGAVQVPIVGLAPIKSLEQLGPCAVFFGYQLLRYIDVTAEAKKMDASEKRNLFFKVAGVAATAGVAIIAMLYPTGYFGPLSSRIRGLFVQHTRTGNPLVDSVAEHQPTSPQAYYQFLNIMCYFAPMGFIISLVKNRSSANTFLHAYAAVSYYFCSKMSRLVVLLGPIGSSLGGVAIGFIVDWCIDQLFVSPAAKDEDEDEPEAPAAKKGASPLKRGTKAKTTQQSSKKAKKAAARPETSLAKGLQPMVDFYESPQGVNARKIAAGIICLLSFGTIRHHFDPLFFARFH